MKTLLIILVLCFTASAQVLIVASQPTLAPHDCYCGVSCKCDSCECNVSAKPTPKISVMKVPAITMPVVKQSACANSSATKPQGRAAKRT